MRLFVAVDVEEALRDRIWQVSEKISKMSGIKVVERENLHATLQFLGEVESSRVEDIKKALSNVKFEPFKIKLKGVGKFPPKGDARVVWIGVEEGEEELKDLAERVSKELKKLGFQRDKEFEAHFTIARVKRKNKEVESFINSFKNYEFGEMVVKDFKLKQSILRQSGPIYIDLEIFKG